MKLLINSQEILVEKFRKNHLHVIEYFIKTNQLTGEPLDDQNRNILFHALPLGNTPMIEHLLKSVEYFHSISFLSSQFFFFF